jgi:putative transposase
MGRFEDRPSMSDSFTNLVYHIVFSTKNRQPLISDEIRALLYAYIGGIVRGQRGLLLEIGGMPDHVHLLARFRSDASVAEMVRLIKANSSKWMNERTEEPGLFQWQTGYGAFSVSESRVPTVRAYIQNQREHHARVSLRDELITLLKRHRIEFDERYLSA